ncbi:hypothetical protein N9Z59_02675 [Akkermansiaceae bacterium]|nr:hypothetical protein [Akkermansiaceae bacterium]
MTATAFVSEWLAVPGVPSDATLSTIQASGSALSANSWKKIGDAVTATGTVSSQTEAVIPRLRSFYRYRHVLFE